VNAPERGTPRPQGRGVRVVGPVNARVCELCPDEARLSASRRETTGATPGRRLKPPIGAKVSVSRPRLSQRVSVVSDSDVAKRHRLSASVDWALVCQPARPCRVAFRRSCGRQPVQPFPTILGYRRNDSAVHASERPRSERTRMSSRLAAVRRNGSYPSQGCPMAFPIVSRVILATGLLASSAVLHFGICDWVLRSSPWEPTAYRNLWVISTKIAPVSATRPHATTIEGRVLRVSNDTSPAEGWALGVAVPILFLSAAAALLVSVPRLRRLATGHCPRCNHDLRFEAANGCSECGWRGASWPEQ